MTSAFMCVWCSIAAIHADEPYSRRQAVTSAASGGVAASEFTQGATACCSYVDAVSTYNTAGAIEAHDG